MTRLSNAAWLVVALVVGYAQIAKAADKAPDKKIERLWKSKCSSCHGADGTGKTEAGKKAGVKDLATADVQGKSDADLKAAIKDGVKKDDKQVMEPFADLKDDQVDGLVQMIKSFKKK